MKITPFIENINSVWQIIEKSNLKLFHKHSVSGMAADQAEKKFIIKYKIVYKIFCIIICCLLQAVCQQFEKGIKIIFGNVVQFQQTFDRKNEEKKETFFNKHLIVTNKDKKKNIFQLNDETRQNGVGTLVSLQNPSSERVQSSKLQLRDKQPT